MNVPQIVEAVLFAADAPLTAEEIARADEQLDEDRVEEALQMLQAEYDDAQRAFEVVELAEGYQILTRPEFAPYLERFDNVPRPSRLSGPSLETLAIIAYRQPIGRIEIEYIRGVGSSGVIRTLQERRLIDVVGRDEGLGRPLLYGTTKHFLEHFGFRTLEALPRPDELPIILRDRVPLGPEETEEPVVDENQVTLALGDGEAGDPGPDEATEVSEQDEHEEPAAAATGDADGDASAAPPGEAEASADEAQSETPAEASEGDAPEAPADALPPTPS